MARDTDPDDNIFGTPAGSDTEIDDIIGKMLDDIEDEPEDGGGLETPIEEPDGSDVDVISHEDGRNILADAEIEKGIKKKAKATAAGEQDGDEDEKPEAKAKEDDKAPSDDIKSADFSTLLEGLPDDRRGEVTRRLRDAESALEPFKAPYIQEQMKEWGASPQEVAGRLVELATFARQKPAEYIAWIATQSATPEKMTDLLNGAATLLGYKVVKADGDGDDDDDMFEDPEVRALREENQKLKAQIGGGPEFGPDTPERQQTRTAQQELSAFINAVDERGAPLRPMFETLRPRIAEMAAAQQRETGKAVTTQDLQSIYDRAVDEARRAFGGANPGAGDSAAKPQNSVEDQAKKKADAARKAQRASKTIDGTGQGAARHPAIRQGAPLDEVINTVWDQIEKRGS